MTTAVQSAIPVSGVAPSWSPVRQDPDGGWAVVYPRASWRYYEATLEEFGESRLRVTFDGRRMEVRMPSFQHEDFGTVIALLVHCLARGYGLKLKSGGSTTFKSEQLGKGLEPDKCFWFRGPPIEDDAIPELAIEIDVTRSSLDRLAIYAALGVREVWRFDGERAEFLVLTGDRYVAAPVGLRFPAVVPADLPPLVERSKVIDEIALEDEFRAFVRARLAEGTN
jgi:Uma2 family endonuclease